MVTWYKPNSRSLEIQISPVHKCTIYHTILDYIHITLAASNVSWRIEKNIDKWLTVSFCSVNRCNMLWLNGRFQIFSNTANGTRKACKQMTLGRIINNSSNVKQTKTLSTMHWQIDFPSVLWYCWLGLLNCKNRLPYNLYCVGGDVKHCTIQSNRHTHNSVLTCRQV